MEHRRPGIDDRTIAALALLALLLGGCLRLGFDPPGADPPPPDGGPAVDAAPDGADDGAGDGASDGATDADGSAPADSGGDIGGDSKPPTISGPGSWSVVPAAPMAARIWTSAVWTGKAFLVFGGALDSSYTPTNTAALYDPITNAWTAASTKGAAGKRHTPLLVWSGQEMIEYGGGWGLGPVSGGGRYDPTSDSWAPMSTQNAPGLRIYGRARWIGTRMMVWGGWANAPGHYPSGYLYDPVKDTWTSVSAKAAPSARSFHGMVWTGSRVIIWGGCDGSMGACAGVKADGAIYDPSADTWKAMSTTGAPGARSQHSAVWTGSEMIVFGGATKGSGGGKVNDGAIYNPSTDTWRPLSSTGAPSPRADHAAVWFGDKMLIWGSVDTNVNDGFLYDPVTDTWSPMAALGASEWRSRFAYAAGGGKFFVWGGSYTSVTGWVWSPQ